MDVVGEASSGAEVIEEVRRLRPDVVLNGRAHAQRRQGSSRFGACRLTTVPTRRYVMLTTFDMDEYIYVRASSLGASGFILLDVPPEQLVAGHPRRCQGGDALLAPSVTPRRVIEEFVRRPPQTPSGRRRPNSTS